MALESASFISGLVSANPPGTDAISQGDDHLRLIKTVLKASLPNADAAINGIHTKATEPSSTSAGLIWFDTTDNLIKIRNEANDAWIILLASEGSRLLKVTHNIPVASSYMRTESYADTAQTITHTAVSTSSTFYITYNGNLNYAFNFEHASAIQAWVELRDSAGAAKIAGTTSDILWAFTDDVGEGTGVSWDNSLGVSRTWKVIPGNRPTPDSGTTYTFDIWSKMNEADDGGTTFKYGTMTCLEVEE